MWPDATKTLGCITCRQSVSSLIIIYFLLNVHFITHNETEKKSYITADISLKYNPDFILNNFKKMFGVSSDKFLSYLFLSLKYYINLLKKAKPSIQFSYTWKQSETVYFLFIVHLITHTKTNKKSYNRPSFGNILERWYSQWCAYFMHFVTMFCWKRRKKSMDNLKKSLYLKGPW